MYTYVEHRLKMFEDVNVIKLSFDKCLINKIPISFLKAQF